MIIALISCIILIIGVIMMLTDIDCIFDIGDILCTFASIGVLVGLLIFIIGVCCPVSSHIEKEETISTQYIYALNDTSSIEEQFFLISGSVDEKYTIRYVINTSKGKQVKEIKGNNIYIKEGNYKPHLEYHDIRFKNKKWYLLFSHPNENYTVFYIPENSIINDYNLDLQ